MRTGIVHGRRLCVAVVGLLLAGSTGCTYLRGRGADASQMMDLGFTFSKKPQFGLYANCPMVTPLGYSKVDGYFVGLGGGTLGAGEHHQNNSGLLFWGHEENSWKGFGGKDKTVAENHRVGVVGIAENAKDGSAKYRPACVHYLHLGYVGIMWNLNYYKMADFFCGWFGWIPFGDRNEVNTTRVAKAGKTPKPATVASAKPTPPVAAPATPPAAPAPKPATVAPAPTPAAVAAAAPAATPKPIAVASAPPVPPVKVTPVEGGSSPFALGPPAPIPSTPEPATVASAAPKPPVPTPAPVAPASVAAPAPKPAKAERVAEAPLPPLPPDEIALAVARDVAAAKAELAALRQAESAPKPSKLVAGTVDEAPADAPKSRFPIEHLVP